VIKVADNKKYYYLKLKENFFDSDELILLESQPDGYLYSNILLKLYLRSLKNNGKLMFNDRIPYNAEILSKVTRHNVAVVEKALYLFEELGLIEKLSNGAIYMLDIQNFIGKSSTEADRKRNYRNIITDEKAMLLNGSVTNVGQMSHQMSDKNPPEIEKEIEIEIEKEIEIKGKIDYQKIVNMYNDICISFSKVSKLSEARKKSIKARMNTYDYEDFKTLFTKAEASDFLKGKNSRDWQASFDWLIKDTNMVKVLDGNYDNKGSVKTQTKTSTLSEIEKKQNAELLEAFYSRKKNFKK
jgi:predicted phage replisome organizer